MMYCRIIIREFGTGFKAAVFLTVVLSCLSGSSEEPPEKRHLVIVTNLDNPVNEISKRELERIYLKKKRYWVNGKRCIPIDQPGSSEARATFYRLVFKKNPYEMQRYWMQETMTGSASPPVTLDNSATVKRYVQKIEGGVGYIYADEVSDSVKVLRIADLPEFNSREKESDDDKSDSETETGKP